MAINFKLSNLQSLKVSLIITFAFFSFEPTFAQSAKSQIRKGNRYVRKENYLRALPIFEKALEAQPDNLKAIYKSGVCYLHRYSKEKGLENIKKAIETDSKIDKHANYWMGRALQLNYKFDEAKEYYEKYAASLKKRDSRKDDVKKHIEQCSIGKEMLKNPGEFYLENLGPKINSKYSDHSPVLNDDATVLLFTSRKETSTGNVETMTGEFFEDIYVSEKKGNEWGALSHIGEQLNTTGHDACSHLFDNGNKLLMYRSTRNGDIYLTEKKEGKWGTPQRFPVINSSSYESSAFMAHDGKRIYFSTNRYSDGGDLDFYYSDLQADGTWGAP
ncbi:MAG: tetratricopeptide repeat protein, partial [Cytophagales bacterium]